MTRARTNFVRYGDLTALINRVSNIQIEPVFDEARPGFVAFVSDTEDGAWPTVLDAVEQEDSLGAVDYADEDRTASPPAFSFADHVLPYIALRHVLICMNQDWTAAALMRQDQADVRTVYGQVDGIVGMAAAMFSGATIDLQFATGEEIYEAPGAPSM